MCDPYRAYEYVRVLNMNKTVKCFMHYLMHCNTVTLKLCQSFIEYQITYNDINSKYFKCQL